MTAWLHYDTALPKKREVLRMARRLKISTRETVALCLEVWTWADAQTETGFVAGVVPEDLDVVVGIPGFGAAYQDAGWLIVDPGGLTFPNFDRWNGKSAKKRLLAAERKRTERERQEAR